ncbi:hypothetical protein [Sorangium sp. So ce1153]|uniref:hypothetical protein n=1 Tax=Sorangium sp. So ce1153 TaxID=3133333 RepID=UPI003F638B12
MKRCPPVVVDTFWYWTVCGRTARYGSSVRRSSISPSCRTEVSLVKLNRYFLYAVVLLMK